MNHRLATTLAVCLAVAFAGGGFVAAHAQQAGIKRTLLLKQDLSVEGREVVMGTAELAPGASAGKHTHPGEEVGYVLEGNSVLEVDGKPPLHLKPGDTYAIAAGVPHDAKNEGSANAKLMAVWIVEKGKPLATPVK